jgi:hypothetical protein
VVGRDNYLKRAYPPSDLGSNQAYYLSPRIPFNRIYKLDVVLVNNKAHPYFLKVLVLNWPKIPITLSAQFLRQGTIRSPSATSDLGW